MGTGRSEGESMTPENTPRMAERTDRQAQIDGMFDACRQVANSLPLFVIVGTTAMANPLGSDLEHTDERRFNPSGKVFARVEDAAALPGSETRRSPTWVRTNWCCRKRSPRAAPDSMSLRIG